MTEPENPRPEVEGDCDDLPKLTAEEWAYVVAVEHRMELRNNHGDDE
jgi:hypothetical protein